MEESSKRLNTIFTQLRQEHFSGNCAIIYKILATYFLYTKHLISQEHFVDLLGRMDVDAETNAMCISLFIGMKQSPRIEESDFRYNIAKLKEQTKQDLFVDALTDSMDVLMSQKKFENIVYSGYDGAVSLMQLRLHQIETLNMEGAAIIYVNKEINRVLENYSEIKFGGKQEALSTGFGDVDEVTSGGYRPGDLVFIAGYTSEGKSTLLYTEIDNWVFKLKKNIALGTAELSPNVVQRRMACIRSADPKYGFESPLTYKKLKEGRLDRDEERQLEIVVSDMANGDYGRFAIFKVPARSTVSSIFSIIRSLNQVFKLDAFAWDYINYSTTDIHRNTDREESTHVVRDAKVLASNFDGRGIPVISPFQVARHRWETAIKEGFYTMACLAETSEAEKAADIVWSILYYEARFISQVLKNRDGPKILTPFEMPFDTKAMRFVARTQMSVL